MKWTKIIEIEQRKDYYHELDIFLQNEYKNKTIYPSKNNIFKAFDLTSIDELKVIIIGQDPYHQANQAQGLAFSTPKDIKNPPSLRNILKEIENEFGKSSICKDGDLTLWARQGVLLINTILTVGDSKPKSHHNQGWEEFTTNIIKYISTNLNNIVFILWGSNAIKNEKIIDINKHKILKAPHPSPLSSYRGFFGCDNFINTNKYLESIGKKPIDW